MAVVVVGRGAIGRATAVFFSSSLLAFLFVSFLLLSFRSAIFVGTLTLTSFLDRDPAVRSLLSRLDSSSPSAANRRQPFPFSRPPHPHRHPFLNPYRFATLDDDHHHDNDNALSDADHHSVSPHRPPRVAGFHNSSFLLVADGIGPAKLLGVQTVRVWDPPRSPVAFAFADNYAEPDEGGDRGAPTASVGFRLFGQWIDLDRRDAAALLHLACLLSGAHAYAIMGFLLTYSCAFGVVCFAGTGALLRKRSSFSRTIYYGSRLGFRRLPVLLLLRWSLRDALAQFLCIVFFSEVKDQHFLLKLFVKVKLMPFTLTALPPSIQLDADIASLKGFVLLWNVLDTAVAITFSVNCWVAILERYNRQSRREVVKEGCYLVFIMISQATMIRCLETLVCGKLGMRLFTMIGGPLFAMALQSVAEVYFMVLWLMFYFSARRKAGDMDGRRFRLSELEDLYDGLLR